MAAIQLGGQRHNADVVQGPVGCQHIVESVGLKGAQVGLGVCTSLFPADEWALQVHPWVEGRAWLQPGPPSWPISPSHPHSPVGIWRGRGCQKDPKEPPRVGGGERGQPLTEDPCPMGTTTLHRDLRKDLGGTSC